MATCESPHEVALASSPLAGRHAWAGIAPAFLIAATFVPVLVLFGVILWSRPHYQFFPLLVPGAVALVWRSCRHLGPLAGGTTEVAWSLAALSWLSLAAAVAFLTPWFGGFGLLVALLGSAYALGGWRLTRAALPAWGLLWLAIPPPRNLDWVLVTQLQDVVSRWSSRLLDVIGVFHVMNGNVVEVPGHELLVDQACSGVNSLVTLLAGGLFYAGWVHATPVRAALLAVSSVFWVLFGNVVRIVTLTWLETRWGIDVTTGWKHTLLGLATFVMMLGLLVCTDRMLVIFGSVLSWVRLRVSEPARRQSRILKKTEQKTVMKSVHTSLFRQTQTSTKRTGRELAAETREAALQAVPTVPGPDLAAPAVVESAPLAAEPTPPEVHEPAQALPAATVPAEIRRTWLGSWGMAAAFAMLLLPQMKMPGVYWKELLEPSHVYETRFGGVRENAMPGRLGSFRRTGFRAEHREWDNSWGQHSRVWSYWAPDRLATVSVDYHFNGWHELPDCYKARGWRVDSQQAETTPLLPGDPPARGRVMALSLSSVEGRHAFLVFAIYDRLGRPLDLPGSQGAVATLGGRLASWFKESDFGGREGQPLTYQVQLLIEGQGAPTPANRVEALAVFGLARAGVEKIGSKQGEGVRP